MKTKKTNLLIIFALVIIKILLVALIIILLRKKQKEHFVTLETIPVCKSNCFDYRINKTKDIIKNLKLKQGSKILDIGGNNYVDFCKNNNYDYTMIDLKSPQKTGGGGYYSGGLTYDGRNLPFKKNTFDLVIVSFVFHHASNNTLFLLKQIKDISRKYILVGEDLSELNYPMEWHKRNFEHQPGGVFRSDEEWKELFNLYNLKLIKQFAINHEDEKHLGEYIFRTIYLLEH
jgi:SAM-dependent methyltransferase